MEAVKMVKIFRADVLVMRCKELLMQYKQFAIDKKVGMEAGGSEGNEKCCNDPVASGCMTTLASIDAGNQIKLARR